jgi:predicted negative regulator of RcsB-dependent stress response
VETYTTEEEQVEALRRWWDENGRSVIFSVIIALAAGFGWKAWQAHQKDTSEGASNIYQSMLLNINVEDSTPEQQAIATGLAVQLKTEYDSTTYAQFAALHLASLAVSKDNLAEAEGQLRWVLARADKGGDVAQVTELRLARVLAAAGKAQQGLDILQGAADVSYGASYALARGDILLQLGRTDEAKAAYLEARALIGQSGEQINLATLDQKLQSLMPRPARDYGAALAEQDTPAKSGEEQ